MNKQIKCLKYALIGAAIGLAGITALGCIFGIILILTAATMYIFNINNPSILGFIIFMVWTGIILGMIIGAVACMEKKEGDDNV